MRYLSLFLLGTALLSGCDALTNAGADSAAGTVAHADGDEPGGFGMGGGGFNGQPCPNGGGTLGSGTCDGIGMGGGGRDGFGMGSGGRNGIGMGSGGRDGNGTMGSGNLDEDPCANGGGTLNSGTCDEDTEGGGAHGSGGRSIMGTGA